MPSWRRCGGADGRGAEDVGFDADVFLRREPPVFSLLVDLDWKLFCLKESLGLGVIAVSKLWNEVETLRVRQFYSSTDNVTISFQFSSTKQMRDTRLARAATAGFNSDRISASNENILTLLAG